MHFYSSELIDNALTQQFAFIKLQFEEHVLTLTLNRAAKKNALHPQMVNEIAFAMQFARTNKDVRGVMIRAEGTVFCAGADLKAMMGMIEPFESSIPEPEGDVLIGELFNKVHKPTIAVVEGDVYAGGFFFLAGSTYVVANEQVKLGLPEVKRGLYPFQVMAALLEVMPKRKVIDWCIRGYNLPVQQAAEFGLVTHVVNEETLQQTLDSLIADISANSPSAIRLGLEALDHIRPTASEHAYLSNMLMQTIQTKDGQEGLKAFREKRPPVWTGE